MGDVVVMTTAVVCAGVLMVLVFAVPALGLLLLMWAVLLLCGGMAALARHEIKLMQAIEREG